MSQYYDPFTPARASESPWRDELERAADKRRYAIHWWKAELGDWVRIWCEVRNHDLLVVKRGTLTKRADHFEEGSAAEGVAEWMMNPVTPTGAGENSSSAPAGRRWRQPKG